MKRYILALALMVLCGSCVIILLGRESPPRGRTLEDLEAPQREPERAVEEIVESVGPAVVAITTRETRGVGRFIDDPFLRIFGGGPSAVRGKREGFGSGVIFDGGGYVVTNSHVIGRAREIEVTLADGRQVGARLCGRDSELDIAVIRLDVSGVPSADFGRSDHLDVGQWVLAFGNPFGIASRSAQPSVSLGVISALHRNLRAGRGRVYRDMIQTDAAINVGNNGGPLVDLSGKVVGLNTLIVTSSGASTGVGFAMPSGLFRERCREIARRCGAKSGAGRND